MTSFTPTLAFLSQIGPIQWVVIGVVGLLIFGKRLPEVGRSLGKGIVEFKKGLQGIGDEIEQGSQEASKRLENPKSQAHGESSTGPAVSERREAEPAESKQL